MIDVLGGLPGPLKIFVALLVVLLLVVAAAWALRRFGGGRLGPVSTRGRQPRLAVVDGAPVDARRRLILVRRDNVEHLLMIGGPTDVVVEQNIVRGVALGRELPRGAANGIDMGLRGAPYAEAPTWPPAAEPELPVRGRPMPEPVARIPEPSLEPGPRAAHPAVEGHPGSDFLPRRAAVRDLDLGLTPPAAPSEPARGEPETPRPEPRGEPMRIEAVRSARAESARETLRGEPRAEPMRADSLRIEPFRPEALRTEAPSRHEAPRPQTPRQETPRVETARSESPRAEAPRGEPPRFEFPRETVRPDESQPAANAALANAALANAALANAVSASAPESPAVSPAADQNLAEMAQRLEAALRRPPSLGEVRPGERPPSPLRAAPPVLTAAAAATTAPAAPTPSGAEAPAARAPRAAPASTTPAPAPTGTPAAAEKPEKAGKNLYDSLEQEMASLLGRPAGKT